MSAKIEYMKNEIRVRLDGEIDHHSASIIRLSIDDAIIHKRPKTLILDFGAVSFMDSSGIGLIMGRYRLLQGWNGRLIISHLSAAVRKLILLAGLGTLPIFDENRKEGSDHETV